MAVYIEREDKLHLTISKTDKPVKIQVDCKKGTSADVRFKVEGSVGKIECGKEIVIGKASDLKDKTVFISIVADNLDDGEIQIHHRIFEQAGGEVKYVFPDEYSGDPVFDKNDSNPTYIFTCRF